MAGERRLVAIPITAYVGGIEEGGEIVYECPDRHADEDAAIDCPYARAEFRWPGLEQIGARLRELRERNHLTIEVAAERLEISHSKVSRFENGSARPQVRDMRDILDLYQVPEDDPERDRLIQQVRRLWGKG